MSKTALITGASSGIGEQFALIHAAKKGNLVLVARSIDKLNDMKRELEYAYGIKVFVIEKDLSKQGAGKEVYKTVKNEGITVDYLINNAGFGGLGKFHERKWEDDLNMINLNIIALTELTRFFLPDMVAKNEGKILNVSSTASLMPGPLQAVYFATKAYVTSFSNAIHEELSKTSVTVTALLPGATNTGFGETSGMDKTPLFDKTFPPEEVAQTGYEGMLNGELNVKAGLSFGQKMMMASIPLTPTKILLKQVKKMQSPK